MPRSHISYTYLSHKVVIFSQRNTVEPRLTTTPVYTMTLLL